jgi:hypothetical protein
VQIPRRPRTRQPSFRADFVAGDFNAAPLLVEAERVNLGGASVDGDSGDSIDAGEIAQVTTIGRLVDLQTCVERHQAGRDDAFWIEMVVTHWPSFFGDVFRGARGHAGSLRRLR